MGCLTRGPTWPHDGVCRLAPAPERTDTVTIKTQLILDLLQDARRTDRDLGAACGRMIASNLRNVRWARKAARQTRNLKLRTYFTKRADRTIRNNRRIRELAMTYGWTIAGAPR